MLYDHNIYPENSIEQRNTRFVNKIAPLQQEGLTLRLKSKNLKISFELFST